MGVDVVTLLVPVFTILAGLSFLFGNAAQSMFESVMFILIQYPYDISDRVRIPSMYEHAIYVYKIRLMDTTFKSIHNRLIMVQNCQLAKILLINETRSPEACFQLDFKVAYTTPPAKINAIRQFVVDYVYANQAEWIDDVFFDVSDLQPDHFIQLAAYITHRANWSKWREIFPSRSRFIEALWVRLNELGVQYMMPPIPVGTFSPAYASFRSQQHNSLTGNHSIKNGVVGNGMSINGSVVSPAVNVDNVAVMAPFEGSVAGFPPNFPPQPPHHFNNNSVNTVAQSHVSFNPNVDINDSKQNSGRARPPSPTTVVASSNHPHQSVASQHLTPLQAQLLSLREQMANETMQSLRPVNVKTDMNVPTSASFLGSTIPQSNIINMNNAPNILFSNQMQQQNAQNMFAPNSVDAVMAANINHASLMHLGVPPPVMLNEAPPSNNAGPLSGLHSAIPNISMNSFPDPPPVESDYDDEDGVVLVHRQKANLGEASKKKDRVVAHASSNGVVKITHTSSLSSSNSTPNPSMQKAKNNHIKNAVSDSGTVIIHKSAANTPTRVMSSHNGSLTSLDSSTGGPVPPPQIELPINEGDEVESVSQSDIAINLNSMSVALQHFSNQHSS